MGIKTVADSVFERYVNFEFYKRHSLQRKVVVTFERYVNFEFYKPRVDWQSKPRSLRDM